MAGYFLYLVYTLPDMKKSGDWKDNIRFIPENENAKDTAIDLINAAIEQDGDFLESECLVGGFREYMEDLVITITENESQYYIDLSPKSGEGHDFSFSVDKGTKRIDKQSFAVGEVLPEPAENKDW